MTTAIVALLVAIAVPTAMMVLRGAKSTSCLSNLRSIGQALALYTDDNDGAFPPYSWVEIRGPRFKAEKRKREFIATLGLAKDTWFCPLDEHRHDPSFLGEVDDFVDTSYMMSPSVVFFTEPAADGGVRFLPSRVKNPARFFLLHDQPWFVEGEDGRLVRQTSHKDRLNVLFLDWHAKNLSISAAEVWVP